MALWTLLSTAAYFIVQAKAKFTPVIMACPCPCDVLSPPWCPLIPISNDFHLERENLVGKDFHQWNICHSWFNSGLENAKWHERLYDIAKAHREMIMEITEAVASAKKKLWSFAYLFPSENIQICILSNTVCHHDKTIPRSIWRIPVSNWCSCAFQVLTTEFCPTLLWVAWLSSLESSPFSSLKVLEWLYLRP